MQINLQDDFVYHPSIRAHACNETVDSSSALRMPKWQNWPPLDMNHSVCLPQDSNLTYVDESEATGFKIQVIFLEIGKLFLSLNQIMTSDCY